MVDRYRPRACEWCGAPVTQPTTGRPRRWCSDACGRAYAAQLTTVPPLWASAGVWNAWERALPPLTPEEWEAERPAMEAYGARITWEEAQPDWSLHDQITREDWPLERRGRRWADQRPKAPAPTVSGGERHG